MHVVLPRSAWIKGPHFPCEPRDARVPPLRLVLLGAPGVGKGTLAELVSIRHHACQLSTGDLIREAKRMDAAARTPALMQAFEYMERGELVPDATMVELVRERSGCFSCPGGGFLLDGFPRTVAQAEALDTILAAEGVSLQAVVSLDLPLERIVARLGGRRTCPDCKAIYHLQTRPPRREGLCDVCGGALVQRNDDRPETIRVRLRTYETSTAPLIGYYAGRGLLLPVSAEGTPEEIYARLTATLNLKTASGGGIGAPAETQGWSGRRDGGRAARRSPRPIADRSRDPRHRARRP